MTSFSGNVKSFSIASLTSLSGESWDVLSPNFFLPCDWGSPVRVTTAWDTSIIPNQNDGEARRARIGRPTRRVDASVLASTQNELAKQLSLLSNSGIARTLFPIYADQVNPSTSNDPMVTTQIDIRQDLRYYRFVENQYIVIYDPTTGNFDIRQIGAIIANGTVSRIGFNPGVSGVTTNFKIMPLLQSRLQLRTKGQAITDQVFRSGMTGQELPGSWTLPPAATVNATPSGFAEYNGLPVWEVGPNFRSQVNIEYDRTGRYSGVGVTQVASVYGERMRQSRKFKISFDEREDYWNLLRLFDSRAGRTYSWWMPSYTNEYDITEFTANGCKVASFGPIEDWAIRPYISITLKDGTVEIREIDTVTTNNVEDTLVFVDGAFSETNLDNVLRCGFAQQVRFKKDEITENWLTEMSVEVDIEVVEVVEEKTITLPNLNAITTSGVSSAYDPVSCDTEPDCIECEECANCLLAPDPTGSRVNLDISSATASASNNGLDSSFAAFLEANSPFEIGFTSKSNGYFNYSARIEQSEGRHIDVLIRYDCFLGEWQWQYTTQGLGTTGVTYRACGSCTISGGSDPQGCSSTFSGAFVGDCWNNPRNGGGNEDDDWDINAEAIEEGCLGIGGWKDHTSTNYLNAFTGVPDGESAIMYGIQGEWVVEQDIDCCEAPEPCIQCVNNCLVLLNCINEPISTTTGCFYLSLGLPAIDESAVVQCKDCAITVTIDGGETSCCRGDGSTCPRVSVTMATNCLFTCDENTTQEDICERFRSN
jgi:hypothetical protein